MMQTHELDRGNTLVELARGLCGNRHEVGTLKAPYRRATAAAPWSCVDATAMRD
jgi:hypothetical protein